MVVTIVDKGVFEALGLREDILVVKGVNIQELAIRLNKYISTIVCKSYFAMYNIIVFSQIKGNRVRKRYDSTFDLFQRCVNLYALKQLICIIK